MVTDETVSFNVEKEKNEKTDSKGRRDYEYLLATRTNVYS